MLDNKRPIIIEDGLALLNFPVEFCQVVVLAPRNPLDTPFKAILHLTTFSWETFITATYWSVLGFGHIYFCAEMLSLGIHFEISEDWDAAWRKLCTSDIRYLVGLLLSTLSNLMFLPIISILFSNFVVPAVLVIFTQIASLTVTAARSVEQEII